MSQRVGGDGCVCTTTWCGLLWGQVLLKLSFLPSAFFGVWSAECADVYDLWVESTAGILSSAGGTVWAYVPLRSEDDLQETSPLPYDLGTQVAEHLAGTSTAQSALWPSLCSCGRPELGFLQFTSLPWRLGWQGCAPSLARNQGFKHPGSLFPADSLLRL